MTTRIITCLVGDSYKPSFATVTGRGPHPNHLILKSEVLLNGGRGLMFTPKSTQGKVLLAVEERRVSLKELGSLAWHEEICAWSF